MKNLKRRLILGASIIVCVTAFTGQPGDRDSERFVLPRGEVHEGWLFATGDQVLIEGTVNGDLYAAGGTVEISGSVNGDVLAAGGEVIIDGAVAEDVRAAGGTVRIGGRVEGNCTLAGGSMAISVDALVKDNLLAMGGTTRITGDVEGEVRVMGANMTVSGTVGKNVEFYGEEVIVDPGAMVRGDATVHIADPDRVMIADGTVGGTIDIIVEEKGGPTAILGIPTGTFWFTLVCTLSLLFVALLLVWLLPGKILQGRSLIADDFAITFLWGFLGLVLTPIAVVILLITIIGIPLALFLLVLYLWFLYLSQLSLPVLAGRWLVKEENARGWKLFWPIALGTVVVQLFILIPYFGFLVWLAGAIIGLGALARLTYQALVRSRGGSS